MSNPLPAGEEWWWNRERAGQLINFRGLQWGSIRPTDIDVALYIEKHGEVFVLGEVKAWGQEPIAAQRDAFERLVDIIWETGRKGLLFFAWHNTSPPEDIMLADCKVVEYRIRGDWHKPKALTVKALLDKFIEKVGQ